MLTPPIALCAREQDERADLLPVVQMRGCGPVLDVHASNVGRGPKRDRAPDDPSALNSRSTTGHRRRSVGRGLPDAVADAGLGGDHVARVAVRVRGLELPPQPRHVDVEVVALLSVGGAPHGAQQPAAREHSTRRPEDLLEQLVLARGQRELLATRP